MTDKTQAELDSESWQHILDNLSPEARDLPCFAHLEQAAVEERQRVLDKIHKLLQAQGRTAEEKQAFYDKAVEIAESAGIDRDAVELVAQSDSELDETESESAEEEEERSGPICMTTYDMGRTPRAKNRSAGSAV